MSSIELDPAVARIARQMVEHAGCDVTIHVGHSEEPAEGSKKGFQYVSIFNCFFNGFCHGTCFAAGFGFPEEVLPQLCGPFDMVFFDQRGSRFLKDLQLLSNQLSDEAVVVADNVLKPGAPSFLWHLQEDCSWNTRLVELPDFGSSGVLDWMSVSKKRPKHVGKMAVTQPEEICHLAWQADEMRWRPLAFKTAFALHLLVYKTCF